QSLTSSMKGAGVLDYVTAWHIKATEFIKNNPSVTVAFVSTNSICQGEQVGILWSYLTAQGVKIHFAHRTFKWSNEGRDVAAVHCVIIGFGLKASSNYRIFNYEDIKGEPTEFKATQINPYLVDAPNVHLEKRTNPVSKVSAMNYGSMPIDNGHLIISESEKNQLLSESTSNQKFIFEYMGGDEFINNQKRWCLWLENAEPEAIKNSAFIMARVKQVKDFRNSSGREATQKLASYPTLFGERRQPVPSPKKQRMLENLGFKVVKNRKEFSFGEDIIDNLFSDYIVVKQLSVLNGKYKVDWYVPELKLAIEFDELHHTHQKSEDKKRQHLIETELGCRFIRYKLNV
ncbi:MAG: type IIL restriction-modification enzyme MmeI, partial [Methylococcaceae bacterium]